MRASRNVGSRCLVSALCLSVLSACAGEGAGEPVSAPTLAALEPTGAIQIEEVVVTGRDCPAGSYRPEFAATGNGVGIAFDALAARLRSEDEENSAKYRDRAGCELVIRLKAEEGVSYSVPELRESVRTELERETGYSLRYTIGWEGPTSYS